MGDTGIILEVKGLAFGYGRQEILKGVSFSLHEGEFVSVIGPNGSGKSTLLRCLSKIFLPWKGSVSFYGKELSLISQNELASFLAFVPPEVQFTFSFTVEEVVAMGRSPHLKRFTGMRVSDREIIRDALKLTDASHLAGRRVDELSSGEKQRVMIAQAFAQEPKLIFLDEPTSHLDINHQVELLDLLKKLQKEKGTAILLVSHDLNLAGEYSDRLILMNEGRIHKSGGPHEVLDYRIIEEVYHTVVVVRENPISKRPHVLLISRWNIDRKN